MGEVAAYEQAVWSWRRHLASGGTIPWREWVADRQVIASETAPPGWSPPGAAQLELLRRVAARGGLSGEAMGRLADLVTSRSGPGRGLGQLPLTWPEGSDAREVVRGAGARTGAPPVDPAEVPAEELVRVGAGALTELLLASPLTGISDAQEASPGEPFAQVPEPSGGPRRLLHRSRRRRPAFVLAGAPVTTSAVRRALALAGHVEGGRSPQVFLLAEPFDVALAQVWSARVQQGAPVRWHGFVQRWSGRRELPPSLDLPALGRHWAARVGTAAVHLVVGPSPGLGSGDVAVRAVKEILGLDLLPAGRPASAAVGATAAATGARDLSAAAVDVARRVNGVLGVRVCEERHRVVLGRLLQLLEECDLPGPPGCKPLLTVPEPARDWARGRAEDLVGELTGGGYPVHGSVDGVLPGFGDLATHPRREDSLEVVTACLAQTWPSAGRRSKER